MSKSTTTIARDGRKAKRTTAPQPTPAPAAPSPAPTLEPWQMTPEAREKEIAARRARIARAAEASILNALADLAEIARHSELEWSGLNRENDWIVPAFLSTLGDLARARRYVLDLGGGPSVVHFNVREVEL